MKKLILFFFTISQTFAQSVLLTPNNDQSVNTTKKSNNQLVINALRNIDNDFQIINPGNSKLILSGDFFADNFESITSSSQQSIEFNHLTANRWTIRDYKYSSSIESENNIDAFQILNRTNFTVSTPFHINKLNDFVGFNTSKPLARLHIFNGSSGITATPTDELIIENSGNNFIQMMNPQASESGITFGLPTSIVSGGIVYNSGGSGSLQFRNNANQNRMTIISNGNVGIGTTIPAAKLDINGTAKIGTNGTSITEIIKYQEVKDIAATNASQEATLSFTVPNVQTGSTVHVSPSLNLPAGFIIAHALVKSAGTVEVKFFNATASSINPASMTFYLTIIR